jgi:hypothetical protein
VPLRVGCHRVTTRRARGAGAGSRGACVGGPLGRFRRVGGRGSSGPELPSGSRRSTAAERTPRASDRLRGIKEGAARRVRRGAPGAPTQRTYVRPSRPSRPCAGRSGFVHSGQGGLPGRGNYSRWGLTRWGLTVPDPWSAARPAWPKAGTLGLGPGSSRARPPRGRLSRLRGPLTRRGAGERRAAPAARARRPPAPGS